MEILFSYIDYKVLIFFWCEFFSELQKRRIQLTLHGVALLYDCLSQDVYREACVR